MVSFKKVGQTKLQDAFIQRFEDEYKPALENVIEAVQSISDYIQSYMQARQDDDAAGAATVRG